MFPGVLCPQDFQGNFHSSEAVLQPNIWLKVLPKSLHQFRKRFQIKWFRRLTLPSGLWFPCCEICFRSTRWPLASPGTRQIRRYAQRTALCLARHTQTTEADSGKVNTEEWLKALNKGKLLKAVRELQPWRPAGPRRTLCDNESFIKSKESKKFYKKNNIELLCIPPRSPDLNPIEMYWAWLRKALRRQELSDLRAKKPALGKTAYRARIKAFLKTKRAQTVSPAAEKCWMKEIAKKQRLDPHLTAIRSIITDGTASQVGDKELARLRQESHGYEIDLKGPAKTEVLYKVEYREGRTYRLLCIPESMKTEFLEMAHGDRGIAQVHAQSEAMYQMLRNRYYWAAMRADCAMHVQRCNTCQRTAYGPRHHKGIPYVVPISAPFATVAFVIVGPIGIKATRKGNKYILTAIEYFSAARTMFSRWCVAMRSYAVVCHISNLLRNLSQYSPCVVLSMSSSGSVVMSNGNQGFLP